jgi:RHS repeat-associated protein
VQGFLYEGATHIAAELDGQNQVVSRFVYALQENVPEYMIKGSATYRIITDYSGSVRLVVDAATGEVAQRLDYDEFGRVLNDTRPGFQPFGYAGGLYDAQTGLVHLGSRDYDPQVGRFTTRDPEGFGGGANLYLYVGDDPINRVDPSGRCPCQDRGLKERSKDPEDLDTTMRDKLLELIRLAAERLGLKLRVVSTYGPASVQDAMAAQGGSQSGKELVGDKVTNATGEQSYHVWGLAFDVEIAGPVDPKDPSGAPGNAWSMSYTRKEKDKNGKTVTRRLPTAEGELVGELGEELGLEWGGRWKHADPFHFEWKSGHGPGYDGLQQGLKERGKFYHCPFSTYDQ